MNDATYVEVVRGSDTTTLRGRGCREPHRGRHVRLAGAEPGEDPRLPAGRGGRPADAAVNDAGTYRAPWELHHADCPDRSPGAAPRRRPRGAPRRPGSC